MEANFISGLGITTVVGNIWYVTLGFILAFVDTFVGGNDLSN
jgi:hypothetical protein